MSLSRRQFFKLSAGTAAASMVNGITACATHWPNAMREEKGTPTPPPARHIVQDDRRSGTAQTAADRSSGSFNPLKERGIPIDKQFRNWAELTGKPYDAHNVPAYTRTRIILMNGIEVEAAIFSHNFTRHTNSLDLRRELALTRRIEQQQQKAVSGLIPGDETTLEVVIGYEQAAVDLTAWLARHEPDPYAKQVYDFGLLEDFDHLYRYANLLHLTQGKRAEDIVDRLTEIMPGRPTRLEHRHPFDDVRMPVTGPTAHPLTNLQVLTLVASEQQTMNYYMNIANRPTEPVARGLYTEIGQIEEQHVTQYETLMDGSMSWPAQLVLHEYNECYLYHSMMEQEEVPRIRQIWELHLAMELEHLRRAGDLLRKHDKRDPEEMFPQALPVPVRFESNKQYVRKVLGEQVRLTANGTEFIPMDKLPPDHRYFRYQETVNGNFVPTDQVIRQHMATKGEEYRFQSEGEHPVEELRQAKQIG
jgi:hypothetical protein